MVLCIANIAYMHYNATMHVISIPPEELFQVLADPTRLRVMRLMVVTGEEACLCELVDSLLEPQYKLSRHVKALRQAGLLTSTKDGRWVYHRLVRDLPHLETLYEMLLRLPDAGGIYAQDLQRFQERLCLRESGRCRVGIQTPHLAEETVDGLHG